MLNNEVCTIMVTGGAGFIGANLCRELLKSGKRVVCFDNLSLGSLENIDDLMKDSRFSFIEADVESVNLSSIHVDECYHLASICGVNRVKKEPLKVLLVLVEGIVNLLKWAADSNVKFLYVSSSEIYGTPIEHPQTECYWGNSNPIGPRSSYVEGKRVGEALCRAFMLEKNLRVRIVRLFNVYGPGFSQRDQRVIPCFVKAAEKGNDIIIYGSGEVTRSFCFVDDIVEGLIQVMKSSITEPVNLGYPDEIEIGTLAEMVLRLAGGKSKIKHLPAIDEDPPRRRPDISLAKNRLGWIPQIGLREGLKRTIDWFSNNGQTQEGYPASNKIRR